MKRTLMFLVAVLAVQSSSGQVSASLYDNDGHWFWEGEGVAPDVEVWDDPNILIQDRTADDLKSIY